MTRPAQRGMGREYVYSLVPRKEENAQADPAWRQRAAGNELCELCGRIRPEWNPRPVDVRLRSCPQRPCRQSVWWTGIALMRRDLLADLRPFMERFTLGRCRDARGNEIREFATYYAMPWLIDRGHENSDYKSCPACGAIWLDYRYQPRMYILRREFNSDAIRQDSVGGTVVTAEVVSRIQQKWEKALKFVRVELVDRPPDGIRLPGDPDWSTLAG